jgi:hypothetical protein
MFTYRKREKGAWVELDAGEVFTQSGRNIHATMALFVIMMTERDTNALFLTTILHQAEILVREGSLMCALDHAAKRQKMPQLAN